MALSCIDVFLSEEIIDQRMIAFEAECAAQGKELVVRKRHPLMQARLEEEENERRKRGLKSLSPRASGNDKTLENPDGPWETELLGESILRPPGIDPDEY